MKLSSATMICVGFLRSISVARSATNPMDPVLGVPPQITQGDSPIFTMGFPNHTISQYTLTLRSPDGTVSTPFSSSIFTNVTAPVPNQPPSGPSEPMARFCIAGESSPAVGSYSQPIENAGDWTVSLQVIYHYGANGYEYDAGEKVCISPPFTSETFTTKPITMVVLPSTGGSPSVVPTPIASAIDLQGSVTGNPFLLTTVSSTTSSTTNVATATRSSSARPDSICEKGRGIIMAAFTLFMILT